MVSSCLLFSSSSSPSSFVLFSHALPSSFSASLRRCRLSLSLARCLLSLCPKTHVSLCGVGMLGCVDCALQVFVFGLFSCRLNLLWVLFATVGWVEWWAGCLLVECRVVLVRVAVCTFQTLPCWPSETSACFKLSDVLNVHTVTFSNHTHLTARTKQHTTQTPVNAHRPPRHTHRPRHHTHHHHQEWERSLHAGALGNANHVIWKPWFACVRVVAVNLGTLLHSLFSTLL